LALQKLYDESIEVTHGASLLANFEFDEKNGIIRDKLTGERCLVVYEKGLESVFTGLSGIFKGGIEVLLLESSRAAGRHIVELSNEPAILCRRHLLSLVTKGAAGRTMDLNH